MDTLQVELVISDNQAEVVIGRNKQRFVDFARDVEKIQPQIKFNIPNSNYIDLDKLQKRADQTRKSFEEITKTRLDAGNINFLTKEIVRASERSRQLQNDIKNIKAEIVNPNRKSSIAFLTDELRGAEKEADRLNRKLAALQKSQVAGSGGRGTGTGAGSRGRITGDQAALLEIIDDFAPAGTNRPFNSLVRGALIAGDVKEAASGLKVAGKEMLALVGLSGTALALFGGIAAAGYGIVKATEYMRAEAERYLKVQEDLAIAENKQRLAIVAQIKDFERLRQIAAETRNFNNFLPQATEEDLIRRKQSLQLLEQMKLQGVGYGEGFTEEERKTDIARKVEELNRVRQEILQIDQQLAAIEAKTVKDKFNSAAKWFNLRYEAEKRFAEQTRQAEEKAAKERQESYEKAIKKNQEIEKNANSSFENLFKLRGANNPFVAIFTEADKALSNLRENLKGLSPELQQIAFTLQEKLNANRLFEARLDNNLEIFDLRERARVLRERQNFKIEDPNKFFNDYIEAKLKQVENIRYHSNIFADKNGKLFTNGFSQSDGRNDVLNVYERLANGGTISRRKTFADLTEADKEAFLNGNSINESLNNRLQRQLQIINSGVFSENQRAIADKKLLALTSGLNPSEINASLREQLALVNEREAVRREKSEKDAEKQRAEQLKVSQSIDAEIKKLNALAEKEGFRAVIEIVDKSNSAARVLSATPTQKDVQRTYLDEYQN